MSYHIQDLNVQLKNTPTSHSTSKEMSFEMSSSPRNTKNVQYLNACACKAILFIKSMYLQWDFFCLFE